MHKQSNKAEHAYNILFTKYSHQENDSFLFIFKPKLDYVMIHFQTPPTIVFIVQQFWLDEVISFVWN